MKIVIAGGSGYLGQLLSNHFKKDKTNQIYILSRTQQLDRDNVHHKALLLQLILLKILNYELPKSRMAQTYHD